MCAVYVCTVHLVQFVVQNNKRTTYTRIYNNIIYINSIIDIYYPDQQMHNKYINNTIYIYIYVCVCVCVCCAFAGLDNDLYKVHGTYTKIEAIGITVSILCC
jgi:hypothetical protein